jgi:phage-related protein
MESQKAPKPLFWMGSSRRDLKAFPLPVRRARGFALWQAQRGGKHVHAKLLKGFGGGMLEIVEDHRKNTYRAVYTVKFAGAVYARHAFQKKSTKGVQTPKAAIDVVRKRLKAAEEHYEKWRGAQEEAEQEESSGDQS